MDDGKTILFVRRPYSTDESYVGIAVPEEWVEKIGVVAGDEQQEWMSNAVKTYMYDLNSKEIDEIDKIEDLYRSAIKEGLHHEGML